MARVLHPAKRPAIRPGTHPALGAWLIVAFTLLGFLGQLLVQNQARPDEAPRATIERLTGIDIAPEDCAGTCAMPAMHMAMPGMMQAGMTQAAPLPSHAPRHHHDGSCPLCPLLHIPAIILTGLAFLPLPPTGWMRPQCRPAQPRAPPASGSRLLPPSRAPPATA
ncbi:conserved hypothetical protein [Gluconacetobacter diazotrophicus PA1 5]|uniref:Uncharacterized protein n=2 Tax=Gluconacetobacter diazotrophicus TaxID=33996 RepID=A0A7W4NIN8_GLUDI|nr:hypothetical protein [Gluconacetobacter diazotrophicus]ACI51597.1 conserved hypothetical protein [Gluconacetobacter diazotrophicus PA1 5]MBB2158459.1 hypothetical protein [Gluconacetobacter diazotrophicus]TWB03414.1 hypothetical protein FBZ86_1213 [Gluconacetobacter diazotrophicus]CAP55575.1 hypothetical membrane protein [Gluconacetobacter diazotrophicus PA1 5]